MLAGHLDRPRGCRYYSIMTPWQRFLRYGGGATAIECGVIVALLALVVIAAVRGVGIPPGFSDLR